jgi:hypothetical protein
MGLDMYLTKRIYIKNWNHTPDEERFNVKIERGGKPIESLIDAVPTNISYTAMYWRKANAIHQWFVDNVQDGVDECQESYVDTDKLISLHSTCVEVLKNKELAKELLPTQSGFFFGNNTYDEYYFQMIKETEEVLRKELEFMKEVDLVVDYYYRASW